MKYDDESHVETRRRNLWMLVAILSLGPAAFIGGFYKGRSEALSSGGVVAKAVSEPTPGGVTTEAPGQQPTVGQDPPATSPPAGQEPGNPTEPPPPPTSTTRSPSLPPSRFEIPLFPTSAPVLLPTTAPVTALPPSEMVEDFTQLRSGPLLGHTTYKSTRIWAYQGARQALELVYWPKGTNFQSTHRVVAMPPDPLRNYASVAELNLLDPSTQYDYDVRLQGSNRIVGRGQFRTAPVPGRPAQFRYMLTSCMDIKRGQYKRQPVWEVVRNEYRQHNLEGPDFALVPGDTVYLNDQDWTEDGVILYDRVWYRNLEQRDEPNFANFVANVPMYTTWDDHDYGANNADHRQPGKNVSLDAFVDVWANPQISTFTDTPGHYYSFSWGDARFFVMDCRWYRDRTLGTQFGHGQMEWLYRELLHYSNAAFKVIVTGTDVMERNYADDMDDLGRFVTNHGMEGIIFHAGDIHRNEFKVMENEFWPYPIHQITSSAIAREWRRPFALLEMDTTVTDPQLTVWFYGADSADHDTTWSNNPSLSCPDRALQDRDSEHQCTETVRLSDLSISR